MILQNKQENEEVKRQTIELFELEAKYKAIKKQYEDKKSKLTLAIRNFMYCNKGANDEIQFLAQSGDIFSKDNKMLRVRRIVPKTVIWDADKLEKQLDKEIASRIIQKRYTITDMEGLIAYLRSCGVSAKKFKSFIEVEKIVDTNVIDQLDAVGDLCMEDVRGCFTVQEKSSYLRIDTLEDED